MFKQHVKLFEDFLLEDEIDDILNKDDDKDKEKSDDTDGKNTDGKDDKKKDDEKDKPDPIKKLQDEEKDKQKKSDDNFTDYLDKKEGELEQAFEKVPDIKEEIGDATMNAVKSKDRTKIHVAFNNLLYLQSKYEKAGDNDKVQQVTNVKEILSDLDRSFTSGKHL